MYDTDIRRNPAARRLTRGIGSTSYRAANFAKTHRRLPLLTSVDPAESKLAADLAYSQALAVQGDNAKHHARQLVTAIFQPTPKANAL